MTISELARLPRREPNFGHGLSLLESLPIQGLQLYAAVGYVG